MMEMIKWVYIACDILIIITAPLSLYLVHKFLKEKRG